jgi:hypothetical protein
MLQDKTLFQLAPRDYLIQLFSFKEIIPEVNCDTYNFEAKEVREQVLQDITKFATKAADFTKKYLYPLFSKYEVSSKISFFMKTIEEFGVLIYGEFDNLIFGVQITSSNNINILLVNKANRDALVINREVLEICEELLAIADLYETFEISEEE